MKKVYICSPYRGNTKENIKNAKEIAKKFAFDNILPIVPHIYFTQFLDDEVFFERNLGISMGAELMKLCDELYVYGNISEGMTFEINLWKKLKDKEPIYVKK